MTRPGRRRGRAAIALAALYVPLLKDYAGPPNAPLSEQTRRTYASKVRQLPGSRTGADLDADPLTSANGRDWAVCDYRTHLQNGAQAQPGYR